MHGLLLATVAASSLGCVTVLGSGVVRTDRHEVPVFKRIEISGGNLHVTVRHGSTPRVEVTGDDNLLPLLEVAVEGNTLRIEPKEDVSLRPREPIVVKIWTTGTEAVEVSGGVKLDVQSGLTRRSRLEASGGVELSVAPVDFEALDLEFSGGVQAHLAGKAQRLSLDASGGVEVRAAELAALAVELDVSGGCDVELTATGSIEGEVSGGVDLKVRGNPARSRVESSGGTTVRFAQQ